VPAEQFGWYFGAGAASFITVSQVNRRMVARHGVRRVLGWGVYGLAGGATVLLACAVSGLFGFAGVFLPIFFIIGSIGFIASNATSVAMAPFGERAGAASSLLGATQSAFGVAASAAVGWIGNRGPLPMATVMFACAATAFLAYALLVRNPRSSP
jgi:DHA1 family bicyclomycin/chloramphenicol resistance-like MFS transporter